MQSLSILRYVGRLGNLYPQDINEAYTVDSTLDATKDFVEAVVKVWFLKEEEAKKAASEEILTNTFPKFAKFINERLEKNGNKHFIAGNALSIADVWLAVVAANWYDEKSPFFASLQETVNANPALKHFAEHHLNHTLKAYIAARPETPI